MKALLILFLALPASAQMPEQIADTAVMENQEFLLQEIGRKSKEADITYAVLSGSNTFSSATSTTTFSGWIDIGLVSISSVSVPSSTTVTATCAAGYKTLGCGGKCNNGATAALYVDFSGESACQTKCTAAANNSSVARCARVK